MASFLEKLKLVKEEKKEKVEFGKDEKLEAGIFQLDVDIFQNPKEIIIYAQVPGSKTGDLEITLEGDNDILIIRGKTKIPPEEIYLEKEKKEAEEEKWLCQECKWGNFYRQIILPQEINLEEISAKLKNGILILRLPFLKPKLLGRKKIEIKLE